MLNKEQSNKIKQIVDEFFSKMTMPAVGFDINSSTIKESKVSKDGDNPKERETVNLSVKLEEPQILIGHGGQTLFEIQRLLRMILNKKLKNALYLNLDINDYKNKKTEYLKNFARESADQVFLTKQEKSLAPMSSYERKIVHAELSGRTDVITESVGEGLDRHIVIKPK